MGTCNWGMGRGVVMAAAIWLLATLPAAANAQQTPADKPPPTDREVVLMVHALDSQLSSGPSRFASSAKLALQKEVWDLALDFSRTACTGNDASGCATLGKVLSQPKARMLDARGAEAAHRKAASLYVQGCNDPRARGDYCIEAAEFLKDGALPAARNPAVLPSLYARARDAFSRTCNDFGSECYRAGLLHKLDLAGKPDEAAAARLWRRGCAVPKKERGDDFDRQDNCSQLVQTLTYGPPALQNRAEARTLITENLCTIHLPTRNQYPAQDKLGCAILGDMLLTGQGGPADPKQGTQLLRYSCVNGQEGACKVLESRKLADDYLNAVAMRDLGYRYEALKLFELRCTANDGRACSDAGAMIQRGPDPKEEARRLNFFARACTLGSAVGCYNQGQTLRASGGAANLAAARPPLKSGCDKGDAPSCRLLAVMLAGGEGGPADRAEANRLYAIACDGKDGAACNNLGNAYRAGTGLAADPVRARALLGQACDLRQAFGCANLGDMLAKGEGGPADGPRARTLLEQACKQDNALGCTGLAQLLNDGTLVPADRRAARPLFEKGCNLRNARACVGWSDSLLTSQAGPPDQAKAINARRIACVALDHQPACAWLTDGGHRDVVADAGLMAMNGKRAQALALLRPICDGGNAKGCITYAGALMQAKTQLPDTERQELRRAVARACQLGDQEGCKAEKQLGPG